MIKFSDPPISMTLTNYMKLVHHLPFCSSSIGFCIELGDRFFTEGTSEVDKHIMPLLQSKASGHISPRVMTSYSMLLWFAKAVSKINNIVF